MKANHIGNFVLALFVLTLSVAVVLTLVSAPLTPIPWLLLGTLAAIPWLHKKVTARRFLKWDDSLSVGIKEIDDDHKRLMSLVNQFQVAMDYRTDERFEREAMEALVDYTKFHFAREEELMEKYGYPDFQAHKTQHEEMIALVNRFLVRYRTEPAQTVEEVLSFLKKWLVSHIGGTDQRYARFFRDKENGASEEMVRPESASADQD